MPNANPNPNLYETKDTAPECARVAEESELGCATLDEHQVKHLLVLCEKLHNHVLDVKHLR